MTIDTIIEVVCNDYGMTLDQIKIGRLKVVCEPRQIIQSIARDTTKMTFTEIGYRTGNYDHATVNHSIKVVNNLSETEPKYRDRVIKLITKIRKIGSRQAVQELFNKYLETVTMSTYAERKLIIL